MSITTTVSPLGTWGYRAGTLGTVSLTDSKRLLSIAAHATVAGTVTINGGDAIPIPANVAFDFAAHGVIIDPVLVFAFTDAYFVEYVSI